MHEDPPAVISHAAHPAHMLTLVTTTAGDPPFRCDGCKEPGTGTGRRYRCGAGCEFDLHTRCALAWPTLSHPLLGDLVFTLLPGAPPVAADAAAASVVCIACGVWPAGLVYHCFDSRKKKDIYLHPCCAALTTETVLAGGHRVQLCAEAKLRCVVCGEKKEHGHHFFSSGRKLWAYRWFHSAAGEEGSCYLHVGCMKRIAAQSWEHAGDLDGGGAVLEASVPVVSGLLRRRTAGGEAGSLELGLEAAGSIVQQVVSAAASHPAAALP
ncbi:hypothetical protein HU200_048637 [Digitaria exilis]|uniref:DC1 domain-containing protein n=1 Tax=Digitaria exilis TaxID=1010633 RepID=A0A835EAM3_9POAL|nr:hypothetical protein HU200_048637 [Digitaria exilis]